jgi:ubiquinone biosynthesis UbiH/UbiF/VisC/COQ6 family hydroxylase
MQRADFDIAIVGGGLVGLSLAVALKESGLKLALIEPRPAPTEPVESIPAGGWDNRVYAVSPGTASFLDALGVWQSLPDERVTRVEGMEIYGDDGAARLEFSAYDAGLRELAFIVENRVLAQALWRAAESTALRLHRPASCASLHLGTDRATLVLTDGTELATRLVVGADGADSWVREQAGIAVTPVDYGQLGVVCNFSCEKPHREMAYQWFRRDGVLALLPLAGNRGLDGLVDCPRKRREAAVAVGGQPRRGSRRSQLRRARRAFAHYAAGVFPAASSACRAVREAARCPGRGTPLTTCIRSPGRA